MEALARVRVEPLCTINQVLASVPVDEYWHIYHVTEVREGFGWYIEIWGERRPRLTDAKVSFGWRR